ncbi:lipid II flippase MurJ [Aliarcobacter skirrowii]|uniref:lipid II flippase MurJ n=1 Tax=Aliarcobacter skirrowii TaxID=28200 RepID=UPI0008321C43|nr:lipid II flippase MurJ [Aliarcobacter skirrowii]
MSKKILINSFILSIGILLGRFSGYIRELIIAYKFEVGIKADNIILMLTIPDLLNNLLSAGVISGILIPLLSKSEKIEEIINEFVGKIFFICLFLYLLVVSIIFFIYEFYLFSVMSISLLSIFPNIITFISSSYLQYEQRFKVQSLNTLIFNMVIICFLLLGFYSYIFAIGVILASIVRMLWIINDLKYTKIEINSFFKTSQNKILKYRIVIFMIFSNGIVFILPMIDKLFASKLADGSVAILSYAEKIYLLPVSVFLTTYAVAMFPNLTKLIKENKYEEVNKTLKKSIVLNIFISFIFISFIFIFNIKIVELFYGLVGVKAENILLISQTLEAYLGAMLLAGTNSILLNLFFANKWYNKLIYYSLFMLFLKLILNSIVVYNQFDIKYIAYGTSILILFSVIGLLITYIFSRKENIKS